MLHTLQQAVNSQCDPLAVFSSIICLGWYDGPLSGLLTCNDSDYRYDLVDDSDVLRFRIFQVSPLPAGSVSRFIASMRRFGQLAADESPPSPMWVPMWKFPTPHHQQLAEQFCNEMLESAGAPNTAFCWDFDESRIIAFRAIDEPNFKPSDWFVWLGIERIGECTDPLL